MHLQAATIGLRTRSQTLTIVGKSPMGRRPPSVFGINATKMARTCVGHICRLSIAFSKAANALRTSSESQAIHRGRSASMPMAVRDLKVPAATLMSLPVMAGSVGAHAGSSWCSRQGASARGKRCQTSRQLFKSASSRACTPRVGTPSTSTGGW